ncbi:MAG: alpha/beta fold hydrolase [Anaerolineae bacterium]
MTAWIVVLAALFTSVALAQGPSDGDDGGDGDPASTAHSAGPVVGDPTGISFIENLRARSYGGGSIERLRVIEDNDDFTRYAIRYPSDDISIAGFMDVPKGVEPPYPAVIVAHGFVAPSSYTLLPYSTPYADALARAGYLVVHPNYRNYGASGQGPNPMRSGYAIDVLNLIGILKTMPDVRGDAIGLFGHSMGGEVALRVLVATTDVRAAVLYGSMSADTWENWNLINNKWAGGWFLFDGPFSPWRDREAFRLSSPSSFLDDVTAPIQIHHGTADDTAPLRWATSLAASLRDHGKDVELYTYPGAGHSFGIGGAAHNTMMARSIAFFDSHLKTQQ